MPNAPALSAAFTPAPSASLAPAPSASRAAAPFASLAPALSASRAPALSASRALAPSASRAPALAPAPSVSQAAALSAAVTPARAPAPSASLAPAPSASRAAAPSAAVTAARAPALSASRAPAPSASRAPAPSASRAAAPSASRAPAPSAARAPAPLFTPPPRFAYCPLPPPPRASSAASAASQEEFLHQYSFIGEGSMDGTEYFTDLITRGSNSQDWTEFASTPQEEQFPIVDDSISQRPNQKRIKNFSSEEDNLLVSAWLNVSLDAIQGTDQARTAYWDRIYEYFHTNKLFDSDHSHKSLNKRWTVIQESVNRFCGCLSRIENRNQSGMTIEDKIVQAGELYKSEDKQKKDFTLIQCWNLLKNQPKWMKGVFRCELQKYPIKSKKTTAFSSPAASMPASTPLPHEDESGDANPDYARTSLERPLGRKKEKEKLRQKGERFFYDSLDHLWAKKREDDAEKELKKEERFKQAFALEEERIELEKKKFEFKKMMEKERIMRIDTSGMDSPQKKYYKGLQERIQHDSAS